MDDNKTKPNKEKISKKDLTHKLKQGFSLKELEKQYELPCTCDYLFEIMEEQKITDRELAIKAGLDNIHSIKDYREKRGVLNRKQLKSIASVLNLSEEDSQLMIEVCCSLDTQTIIDLIVSGYDIDELAQKITFPSLYCLLEETLEEKGINTSNLATIVGKNKSTVSRYMSGEVVPPRATLLKIANTFGYSFEKTQLLLKTAKCAVLSTKRDSDLKYIQKYTKKTNLSNADGLVVFKQTDPSEITEQRNPNTKTQDILSSDQEKSMLAMKMLEEGKTIDDIEKVIPALSLGNALKELIKTKGINRSAAAIDIDTSLQYLNDVCDGEVAASRNFVLRFALSQHLSFDETQMLLKNGNFAQLSRNRKRDIIIMEGMLNEMCLDEIDEELKTHGMLSIFSKG